MSNDPPFQRDFNSDLNSCISNYISVEAFTLYDRIVCNDLRTCARLLYAGRVDANATIACPSNTALDFAVIQDAPVAARRRLWSLSQHWTTLPLHLACMHFRTNIIRLLLKHGADPNQRDQSGSVPVEILLRHWKTFDDVRTHLFLFPHKLPTRFDALRKHCTMKTLKLLFKYGASANALLSTAGEVWRNTSLDLTQQGLLQQSELSFEAERVAITRLSTRTRAQSPLALHVRSGGLRNGSTQLSTTVSSHDIDSSGAQQEDPILPSTTSSSLNTPTSSMLLSSNEALSFLLGSSHTCYEVSPLSSPALNTASLVSPTSLHNSLQLENISLTTERSTRTCNMPPSSKHNSISVSRFSSRLRGLMAQTAQRMRISNTTTNYSGDSLIHLAARRDISAALSTLMHHGADVNRADDRGCTALHIAANYVNARVLNQLLLPKWRSADNNTVPDVDRQDDDGCTPLHYLVNFNCSTAVGYTPHDITALLRTMLHYSRDQRAAVNMADYDRNTPLHLAAYRGNGPAVHLLLSAGANADTRNRRGRTPLGMLLSVAGNRRCTYTVELLLQNMAYPGAVLESDEVELLSVLQEPQYVRLREVLCEAVGHPPSLQHICRAAVRRAIGLKKLHTTPMQNIGLPIRMQNYVVFNTCSW